MGNCGKRLRANRGGEGIISSCLENDINTCLITHVPAAANGEHLKSTNNFIVKQVS